MMRRTAIRCLRATSTAQGGGAGDDPVFQSARFNDPSNLTSKWMTEWDIRHEKNGEWAPTHYGGDQLPTMGQFLSSLNVMHPTIEPLFHPLLTHDQKITRLYKRALREMLSFTLKHDVTLETFSFYARQIRAEFEKHREVDKGTAEWLFVRAVNYIEGKKHPLFLGQEWAPGRTYFGRYAHGGNPYAYTIFPHGFDPEEAYKLQNVYHKYGVPYLGNLLSEINPHTFMMRPVSEHNPYPAVLMARVAITSFWIVVTAISAIALTTGGFSPNAYFLSKEPEQGPLAGNSQPVSLRHA
eukprot:TRINITY_DN50662_c0_g1_i1.p1 TRINITY_DN50662_c0_g1~~TRINITY_DN50662_c0_g1_i1.p1  ORF type:complete len:296 (+),score=49.56 TRINITY_DN50662_c0_g1_i1:51-938(+)